MKFLIKDINKFNLIIFLIFIVSNFIGLIYGEDLGGGGSIPDFKNTWALIEDPFNVQNLKLDFKFPLHYYIGSIIYFISFKNIFIFKIFYICLMSTLPIIFFKCLEIKFPQINKNSLFLISLILLILPNVRAAAIWPNTQLTGIFFLLLSLYYFVKLEKKNNFQKLEKNLVYSIIFLSLSVYSRQIFALVFIFYVFYFYQNYSIKNFVKICLLIFLFALPGFYSILFLNPEIAKVTFSPKIYNSIVVNFSIISVYFFPIIFLSFFFKINKFKLDYKLIFFIFFLLILYNFLIPNFNFSLLRGGGIFMKISLLIFNNLFLFFISSFVGAIIVYLYCKDNINDIFLSLVIVIGISSTQIYQKYFEPMMFILIFLLYNDKIIKKIFKINKSVYLFFAYYFVYFIGSLAYLILNLKFKILGV